MSIYIAYGGTRQLPKIGLLEVDAHISEDHQWNNLIPSHPVESGYSVNDAIIRNPMTLTLESMISVAPIYPDVVSDKSLRRADNAYNKLARLATSSTLLSVVTGVKTYRNMAISSLSIPRSSSDGLSLKFNISFQEIRIGKSVSVVSQDDVNSTTLGVGIYPLPLELYSDDTASQYDANTQYNIAVSDATITPSINESDYANKADLNRIESKKP